MPPPNHQPDQPDVDQVKLTYPCRWTYKVVGEDRSALREIVTATCAHLTTAISDSRSSATGRYHSLNVEVTVPDEATRHALYRLLINHPAVKIVL